MRSHGYRVCSPCGIGVALREEASALLTIAPTPTQAARIVVDRAIDSDLLPVDGSGIQGDHVAGVRGMRGRD